MITLKQALEVIKNKHPDKRIIGCLEFSDCYGFSIVTRKWDGSMDTQPVTSTMEAVRKDDGSIFAYHVCDALSAVPDPIPVDITGFISKEDAEFIKRAEFL